MSRTPSLPILSRAVALPLAALLCTGACSPLRKVQRRDPLTRIVVGGYSASAAEADGTENAGSLAQFAYVPGASKATDGDGWAWRLGISAQQWKIEDAGYSPDVLFRDVELFFRQPDLLCTNSAGSQRFRLGGQFGTFWADYKVDGLQRSNNFALGSSRWRTIPLLAYRATLEPEVLLLFGEGWEATAFASVYGAGGAAYPSSGGGDTENSFYDLTSFYDFGYEVGVRGAFGPMFGQISFQARHLNGGRGSADPDQFTGANYPQIEPESSTIEGIWLLVGVVF